MSVYINDEYFNEEPTSCGSCPFFFNGRTAMTPSASPKGHCKAFNEMHNSYRNIPRRCHKLFKKALTQFPGQHVAIVWREIDI